MSGITETEKAWLDALAYGKGMTRDGKHVPHNQFYLDPRDATIADLTARLATAEAERDAALADLLLAGKQMLEFGERRHSDGERRATAAIVAWLKQGGATSWTTEAIERGDHLTSAGDAGEGA